MTMGRDAFLPGAITDAQWQAWNEYKAAGGFYGLYEWVAAGEPTIQEEKAAIAFRDRLNIYLDAQIASGAMSEAEADVLSQDTVDRLMGQGKYKGKRETVIDLPHWIVTGVENYITGLPVAEQKRIDQQIKEAQTMFQQLVQQGMELPLNARGTTTDQINYGQDTIRRLKLQLSVSPDYLQPIIRSQITGLEQSIKQLSESERLRARQATGAKTPAQIQEEFEEGVRTEPGSLAMGFAEKYGMSPEAAQRTGFNYAANPESEEFANLTPEEERDLAWVGIEATEDRSRPKPPKPFETPGFRTIGETGTQAYKSWFARQYPTIVSEFEAGAGGGPRRTEETWLSFLEKERARIKEEFAKQSPYYRGEHPGAFSPRIRTVSF